MLALLVALTLASQDPAAPPAELGEALAALRHGEPGQADFEAALPRLPALIRSGETDLVAGGAYLAGVHARGECAAALFDTFDTWGALGVHARRAVLDALIRLEVPLGSRLLPASNGCDDPTYVLLACDAEHRRDALASLYDTSAPDGPVRWACAVTLARLRDPLLAERLLSSEPWPLQVVAHDPGTHVGAGGGSGMRISCGRPIWPPRVEYLLQLPAADEPLPSVVPYRRVETFGSCRRSRQIVPRQQAQWRRRLLGELLGEGPLGPDADLALEWHGPERFVGGLIGHLREQRARIEGLARELESRGLLERAAEVAARTRFRITLRDLRGDRSHPLPRADLGPGVAWED